MYQLYGLQAAILNLNLIEYAFHTWSRTFSQFKREERQLMHDSDRRAGRRVGMGQAHFLESSY